MRFTEIFTSYEFAAGVIVGAVLELIGVFAGVWVYTRSWMWE